MPETVLSAIDVALTTRVVAVSPDGTVRRPLELMDEPFGAPPVDVVTDQVTPLKFSALSYLKTLALNGFVVPATTLAAGGVTSTRTILPGSGGVFVTVTVAVPYTVLVFADVALTVRVVAVSPAGIVR
jgi:hypothetical protein